MVVYDGGSTTSENSNREPRSRGIPDRALTLQVFDYYPTPRRPARSRP